MEQLRKELNTYSKEKLIDMLMEKHMKKFTYNKKYCKTAKGKETMNKAMKKYYHANKAKILARNKASREKKKREKMIKERIINKAIEKEINNMSKSVEKEIEKQIEKEVEKQIDDMAN